MDIALLALITAAGCVLAAVARKWLVTLGVAVGIVGMARLLGLHPSAAGAVLGLGIGLLLGLWAAVAIRITLAVMHPTATLLDLVRRRTGHTRIGLVVATVRLLVAGRRLVR